MATTKKDAHYERGFRDGHKKGYAALWHARPDWRDDYYQERAVYGVTDAALDAEAVRNYERGFRDGYKKGYAAARRALRGRDKDVRW